MSSRVIDWYGQKEHINEMKNWERGRLKIWEQQVKENFQKGAKILDVGSGIGREAFALYKLGFEVTGLDISKYAVERSNQEASLVDYKVEFQQYDGKNIPFQDKSFDIAIIWSQTFGLLYGGDYKKSFLNECKRVLKPGGLLSYSGHSLEYIKEHHNYCLDGTKFFPYKEKSIYWEVFTLKELENYATEADFEILMSGEGEIYAPEDGKILHCLCRKEGR